MSSRQRALIGVVEVAYDLSLDEKAWLTKLAEHFASVHDEQRGALVYIYDASTPEDGVHISNYGLFGLDESYAHATIEHNRNTPPEDTRRVYLSGVRCGTVSEILEPQGILPREHVSFRHVYETLGVVDSWGLSASNPDGRGVGVAGPLDRVTSLTESARELWSLVAVHLATAYRLRRASSDE